MLNRILPISLLILSAIAFESGAYASHVYTRVSNTGAVFTRDTSNPALGEAYSDPSGVIWGSIVLTAQGYVNILNYFDADETCKAAKARLPTKEEYEQLARYLGQGTAQGYNPLLQPDRIMDILPGLSRNMDIPGLSSNLETWSAAKYHYGGAAAYYFSGRVGSVGGVGHPGLYNHMAVRCVVGR